MVDDHILSPPYRRASIAIYVAVALAAFEGTAVAAVLPQVAGDLGRLDLLPWVVTGYLFAGGVAIVVAGPAIDTLGTRTVFRWSVLTFTVAGTAAGLVESMPAMVAVRLLHGFGGGALGAASVTAVGLVFPLKMVGRAFAANSTVWGVMGVAAPGIAAFMVTTLSWRWVFLVNLPLGILALVAGWSILPGAASGGPGQRRFDLVGTALVACFTFALLVAIDSLDASSAWWILVAATTAGAYAIHAHRASEPVLRPGLLIAQPYGSIGGSIALMLAAAIAINTYVTLYVSVGRGASPNLTAWSVFFFVIGWTAGANLSSRLLDRLAETSVMLTGSLTTLTGLILVTVASAATWPLSMVLAGLFLAGFGVGNATNAGITLLRSVTPDQTMGRANSAHQFLRNLGFTLGSAMGGAVLLLTVSRRLGSIAAVESLLAGEANAMPEVAGAVARGYTAIAATSVVVTVAAVVPMLMLRRHLAEARRQKRATGTSPA